MLAGTTHPRHYCSSTPLIPSITSSLPISRFCVVTFRRDSAKLQEIAPTAAELLRFRQSSSTSSRLRPISAAGVPPPPLDLTEDNINQVLADARVELAQLFDSSVGITGVVELAELDGPFVKISLRGRFWHERSTVLARLGNYLKQRIPEILEVDIEDEKMLDDSPENF